MKKSIMVVLLPTEDKTNIGYYTDPRDRSLYFHVQGSTRIRGFEPQHLYITVSQDVEPIKEGDWCIKDNKLYQSTGESKYPDCEDGESHLVIYFKDIDGKKWSFHLSHARKIIATTNPKLCTTKQNGNLGQAIIKPIGVQQSFLKEFVNNPDGEYEVEYKDWCDYDDDPSGLDRPDLRLVITQDNTVNISSIKNNELKLHVKRLLKLIRSGSTDGNRLHDLKQTATYKTLVDMTKE